MKNTDTTISLSTLRQIKNELNFYYRREVDQKSKIDFTDFIELHAKDFLDEVVSNIHVLGSITEVSGHSDSLDRQKNTYYNLIGLG